jgi:hypothetical protein
MTAAKRTAALTGTSPEDKGRRHVICPALFGPRDFG